MNELHPWDKFRREQQLIDIAGRCLFLSINVLVDDSVKAFALLLFRDITIKYNLHKEYKKYAENFLNDHEIIRYRGRVRDVATCVFKRLYG